MTHAEMQSRTVRGAALAAIVSVGGAAAAETIDLASGERIIAPVRERTDDAIVVEHPIFGEMRIPRSQVRAINADPEPPSGLEGPVAAAAGDPAAATAEQGDTAPPLPPPPGGGSASAPTGATAVEPSTVPAAPPSFPWKTRLEAGYLGNQGNSEDARIYLSARVERTTPCDILRFDARYSYAESNGDRSENRYEIGAYGEWARDRPRWTTFAQTRYEGAEFQPWDTRWTGSAGVGYKLFEVMQTRDDGTEYERFALTPRLGAGFRQQTGSTNEDFIPEGLLGASLRFRINGTQLVTGESTWYPDLGDAAQYRIVSKIDWTMQLSQGAGLSLKLGLEHEHVAQVDPGFKNDDFRAYATLVIEF